VLRAKPAKGLSIMATKKAAKEAKPKKGRVLKYDPNKVLKLWIDGKSISEIADAMKPISKVYVHRVLTTKFAKRYVEGQKQRAAVREKANSAG
jgi:hypothetical protein